MRQRKLYWNPQTVPAELRHLLRALGDEWPVAEGPGGDGLALEFVKAAAPGVSAARVEGSRAVVTYSAPNGAARGVGSLLAGLGTDERIGFETLGVMLDCSRNAVMKLDCLKQWARRLALLGHNVIMLYTEDTFRLPGEPFFGFMRGAYSLEEMKEFDAYAAALGVEVVACMQTLGHFSQVLKWPAYAAVRDTAEVLLVDEPETYALIGKMLAFWGEALRSRRIHVGMDEAHDLGRGVFLDRFGHQSRFDVFNRHLRKVNELCAGLGLKPMIWSDMYFRMGSAGGDYYDKAAAIPEAVKAAIPEDVGLVYWDYYHEDEAFYREWIQRHRGLGHEPLMASGIWTWGRPWYDHARTRATVEPCVRACQAEKLKELLFTLWGDDGAYCEFDSAMAGLAYASELAWGGTEDRPTLAARLFALTGADYRAVIRAGELRADGATDGVLPAGILWDDPLLGVYRRNGDAAFWERAAAHYVPLLADIRAALRDGKGGNLEHAERLVAVLLGKIRFSLDFAAAYRRRDAVALRQLRDDAIPALTTALAALSESFRRQWFSRNKPFGFEIIQIRLAAQIVRHEEAARRIDELLTGQSDAIPELDEPDVRHESACSLRHATTISWL